MFSFADRAEAVLFVTNPYQDSRFRLRVSLYARSDQKVPSLIFYDWEYPLSVSLANLDCFHFANKTTFVRVEPGPAYQVGDHLILRAGPGGGAPSLALEPGEYDLSQVIVTEAAEPGGYLFGREPKCWAETVAGLGLELQPHLIRS
jgi:hypothetical protein